jgi:hypothetical protein
MYIIVIYINSARTLEIAGKILVSVGEANQPEADDETGDEGGEPFQQRVEKRESLSGRCGIVLHVAGLGGYAVPS